MNAQTHAGSGQMFDAIASRYDLLNRIMSLGIDRGWRKKAVGKLDVPVGGRVLDVATGTADIALMIARRLPAVTVVGVDPSQEMLAQGAKKIAAEGLSAQVSLRAGDAQALPFDDASFDAATIAFGIRNVPDRARGLREMARVLKPGAQLVVLELNEPQAGVLAPLVRWHVHHAVPAIGALLSGRDEYRYLQKSIAAFPPPDAFVALMSQNGFAGCSAQPLTFGAACIFVGVKH
jgi:demethylmenaquinone methyltransferase/2-methoxy-6-polyprenyl-1,4-benzoquinol methylase